MNLNVPIPLHNQFKSIVAAQGRDMTSVLLDFIKIYVKQKSPKPNRRRA